MAAALTSTETHLNAQITERAGPRTLDDAKRWMHDKLSRRVHPLGLTDPAATAPLIDQLKGLDAENWANVWGAAGSRSSHQAAEAEQGGNREEARRLYLQAYGFFFLGRFPCPNDPRKLECYAWSARPISMPGG